MSNERAFLWLIVLALMGAGFLLGQATAIAVAATVGLLVVYQQAIGRPAQARAS
jgi:hypothetical protein